MGTLGTIVTTMALAAALDGAAQAQERPAGVDAVLACRAIRPDKAELACFRRAAAMLADPSAATAPPSALPAKPLAFGARPRPVKAERVAQPRQATLVVKSVGDLGDGRAIFTFTDGSTWRETDPDPILGAVRPGQNVVIEKGMLGGYLLDLPHRSVIHVVRMRDDDR
jgi:hypothetical protein